MLVAFEQPKFEGAIIAELEAQVSAGAIRVIDLLLVHKSEQGEKTILEIEDLSAEEAAALGFAGEAGVGLYSGSDAEAVFEGMVPGSAVGMLAIEQTWVRPVLDAVAASGGELAMYIRVPSAVVDDAYAMQADSE